MLAAIYKDESVNTVLMRVYRAAAVGPGTPAKAAEETSPGSPILITRCRRTDKPARADAGSNVKVPPVPASCESLPLSQASNNASPDSAAASQPPPDSSNGGSGEGGILGGG